MEQRLKKELGHKLRHFRIARKMTQEILAEKTGVDTKQISRIERGENDPKSDTITKLCIALKVEPKDLYDFKLNIEGDEYLLEATGTYGRMLSNSRFTSGIISSVPINENFESNFDLIDFALSDTDLKRQAEMLNNTQTAVYTESKTNLPLFKAMYYPNGKVDIEYLDKKFEQESIYNTAIQNVHKNCKNINKLRLVNFLLENL